MFNWLKSKEEACRAGEMPEINASTDLEGLLHTDLLVLFKHSTSCPVSWAAHSQINRFRLKHPEVPVQILNVIKERPTSLKVAQITGIRHESPQVILVRNGEIVTSVSHGMITEEFISELIREE